MTHSDKIRWLKMLNSLTDNSGINLSSPEHKHPKDRTSSFPLAYLVFAYFICVSMRITRQVLTGRNWKDTDHTLLKGQAPNKSIIYLICIHKEED